MADGNLSDAEKQALGTLLAAVRESETMLQGMIESRNMAPGAAHELLSLMTETIKTENMLVQVAEQQDVAVPPQRETEPSNEDDLKDAEQKSQFEALRTKIANLVGEYEQAASVLTAKGDLVGAAQLKSAAGALTSATDLASAQMALAGAAVVAQNEEKADQIEAQQFQQQLGHIVNTAVQVASQGVGGIVGLFTGQSEEERAREEERRRAEEEKKMIAGLFGALSGRDGAINDLVAVRLNPLNFNCCHEGRENSGLFSLQGVANALQQLGAGRGGVA